MGFFDGIVDAVSGIAKDVISPISPLISAGASLVGSANQAHSAQSANDTNIELANVNNAFNADQAEKTNEFNASQAAMNRDWQQAQNANAMTFSAQQAQIQRDYETNMSNTSYQRVVNDLKAAGLNPMLAVSQGGESTPSVSAPSGVSSGGATASGAMATGQRAQVQPTVTFNRVGDALTAASSAAQVAQQQAQVEQVRAQTRNIDADTANKGLQGNALAGQAYQATTQGHVNQATESQIIQNMKATLDNIQAQTRQSNASAQQVDSQNIALKTLLNSDNPIIRSLAPALSILLRNR